MPWFDGVTAAELPVPQRAAFATRLADVLTRLHVPAPADAPVNPVRTGPLDDRDAAVRARLGTGTVPDAHAVAELWDELRATPQWSGPPLWLHGDLHPINLLVDGHGLRAVLDFGDMTAGDPATDLATAWLTFDADGRRLFRERVTYGDDELTWRRARGWALSLATVFVAHSDDNPVMAAIGAHALHQVLAYDV